jgi:protein CWC15
MFCSNKRQKFDQIPTANLDAGDPVDDDDDDDSDDSDSEDDSMLLAELAKIRKERAADQARKVINII